MATPKQQKVARVIIENLTGGVEMSGGDIVESSGYGKSMRLFPGRILESVGVREELKKLGFSIEAADAVIWEMLHKGEKEDTKVKAAQEIYKRMGGYAPEKQETTTKSIVAIQIVQPPNENH